jgi:DNA repair ATPase RecN
MKKLLERKEATEMAISVLYDLTKEQCSMCEWEQDCSDNPLLFDPVFARRYISERRSWFINKQSTCAKCKLKLGEHLLDHQAQHSAHTIDSKSDQAHHKQCFNYKGANYKSDSTEFNQFNSTDLLKLQQALRAKNSENYLINKSETTEALNFNQFDEIFQLTMACVCHSLQLPTNF